MRVRQAFENWPTLLTPPLLRVGEPHVWRVELSRPAAEATTSLDQHERLRAERLVDPRHRSRWVAARHALRGILAAYSDLVPAKLRFQLGPRGKPRLAMGDPDVDALEFNVSHSDRVALIAVQRGASVGVNVERVRPLDDLDELLDRHFSDRERAGIAPMEGSDRLCAFYRGWTRKESVLKAAGVGLTMSLRELSVDWNESARPGVRGVSAGLAPASHWNLVNLHPEVGYAGALASTTPIDAVMRMRWMQ